MACNGSETSSTGASFLQAINNRKKANRKMHAEMLLFFISIWFKMFEYKYLKFKDNIFSVLCAYFVFLVFKFSLKPSLPRINFSSS